MAHEERELLTRYPALRRFFIIGFRYIPQHDAPKYGMLCFESVNQRLFVEPETGYFRAGWTIQL